MNATPFLKSNWRKWHRWLGLVTAILLLWVGVTGLILQFQQFFGEEEAQKEKLATLTSTYSVSSSLADFQAKLAKAQEAVRDKAGDAKLDRVVWQLKGEHPTFTFFTAGKEKLKFVVNADTGVIEKQDSGEDESIWFRLHTGEIIGDGGIVLGIFWGLALVVMTITGLLIFWQLYAARKRANIAGGWRKWFWLIPLAALATPTARAGSPFLTDDPGFAPKGWELKFESVFEYDQAQDILTAPVWDINYTIVEHFKLNLTLAEKTLFPTNSAAMTGLADTDFKFKWRFVDESPEHWWPAVSMAPNVTFPTASESRGLGDGLWRCRVPFQVGKTFGKFYTYAEAGYQFVFGASDQFLYGYALQYQLTPKLMIGAELAGNVPFDTPNDYLMIANAGAAYAFNEHWQLQASLGRSVRNGSHSDPKLLAQLFIQWNFP